MPATLRPYQIEAVEAVRSDWNGDHPNTLLVMATGGGKTVCFLDLLTREVTSCNGRGLIIVHTDELVQQPRKAIRQFWPEWDRLSGTIKAKENDTDARLTVGSIQTLRNPNRMKALLDCGPITHLVVDESHRILGPTYLEAIDRLRDANHELRMLGVTATPIRGDKQGLIRVFNHVAGRYDIRLLVKLGYLVPMNGLAIATGVDLARVRKSKDGDYNADTVADILGKANTWDLIVESHRQYGEHRKSLAFTPNVESAYTLAEAFRTAGITSDAIDGKMKTDSRRRVLENFTSDKIEVLVNCNIMTEGVDIPAISLIHMARMTRSDSLYAQMVGRGMRLFPLKTDLRVCDYAPLDYRNIVMMGDLLGKLSSKGGDITEEDVSEQREHMGEAFAVDAQGNLDFGDPSKLIARSLDYLNASPFEWHLENERTSGKPVAVLAIQGWNHEYKSTLVIYPTDNACYLTLVNDFGRGQQPTIRQLAKGGNIEELIVQGNAYAEKHADQALTRRGRGWRSQVPSSSQVSLLHGYNESDERIETLTMGEASRLLTWHQAITSIRRYGETVGR